MNPVDAANNILASAPQNDANAFVKTLKEAQIALDNGRVSYPRLLWISKTAYQTLSAAGAKFLEEPVAGVTCGSVYGFMIIVEGENRPPRCQNI